MTDGTRKRVRYPAAPNTLAWVTFDLEDQQFEKGRLGVAVDQSHDGCSIVLVGGEPLEGGETCLARVGDLSLMRAEIRWVRPLDEAVSRVGILYLD